MKVKVKLTAEQFMFLVHYIKGSTYEHLTELQQLNIHLFISYGLKKIVDFTVFTNRDKPKTFSIEVNQYACVMGYLKRYFNYLDPFTLSLYITLENQNKPLLN